MISGFAAEGFEGVREQFEKNFAKRGEVGGSVAVVRDGEYLVDLWGGWADERRTRPWEADTIVNVWSTTKGLVAMCAHILIDRRQLELDAPVASYWPEFAQAGKENITVRQLLSHRSGLMGWDEPIPPEDMFNWEKLCEMLAATEPFWEPGTASGYHMRTFGHLVGEVVRRADGRPIGQFLREEIAEPLQADLFIGVPEEEHRRVADLSHIPDDSNNQGDDLQDDSGDSQGDGQGNSRRNSQEDSGPDGETTESTDMSLNIAGEAADSDSEFAFTDRMIRSLSGPEIGLEKANSAEWRSGAFPSSNGHANARGIAAAYGTIASGGAFGETRIFSPAATERMREAQPTGRDKIIGAVTPQTTWGMGFMVNTPPGYGPNPRAFHHGGIGGSLGFCDPDAGFGFGYAMNAMGSPLEDRRAFSLLHAVYKSLD